MEAAMQVNGIIAEYNPFHNGHLYQLKRSLEETGADYTVVAMSGNFVQRGSAALLDKHTRAEMALLGGADLVLELPALYAASSAEFFASGAIRLLDQLGVVDTVSFGSELGDTALLKKAAEILVQEPADFSSSLKHYLKEGMSYPNARTEAIIQHYPEFNGQDSIFSSPNNILGIEYIKALLRQNSSIRPVTIKRLGNGYHDRSAGAPFCSALAIRQALFSGASPEFLAGQMPEEAAGLLGSWLDTHAPMQNEMLSLPLYYKLLSESSRGFSAYLDVSPALSERILNHLGEYRGFEDFCNLLKTKEMTYTRISRCLLHILLNIKKEEMPSSSTPFVPYARVLGFRKSAAPLLTAISKNSSIPLITKLADAKERLEEDALIMLQKDIQISQFYQGICALENRLSIQNEYSIPLVIL